MSTINNQHTTNNDVLNSYITMINNCTTIQQLYPLLNQLFKHNYIFNYNILQYISNIQLLQQQGNNDIQARQYYNTIQLYINGTYNDYIQLKQTNEIIQLNNYEIYKLQLLTIVTLCQNNTILDYNTIKQAINIQDVRTIEDILIDCIYNNLIIGQIDQYNQQFIIYSTMIRNNSIWSESNINNLYNIYNNWYKQCINVSDNITNQKHSLYNQQQQHYQYQILINRQKQKTINNLKSNNNKLYNSNNTNDTINLNQPLTPNTLAARMKQRITNLVK